MTLRSKLNTSQMKAGTSFSYMDLHLPRGTPSMLEKRSALLAGVLLHSFL